MNLLHIKKTKIRRYGSEYKGYLNFLFFWKIPLTKTYGYKIEVERKLKIY